MEFRLLKASEIDARISTVSDKGLSLLLYKDARCDMNILDETVGAMNWKREHTRDNANCIVSIWDPDKEQWISKEDTGTESYTEKEKGLASDSFKRACFNWGIGRELYTAPFLWVGAENCNMKTGKDGKPTCYDRFTVTKLGFDENRNIVGVEVENANTKKTISFGSFKGRPAAKPEAPKEEPKPNAESVLAKISMAHVNAIQALAIQKGFSEKNVCGLYGLKTFNEMTMATYTDAVEKLNKYPDKKARTA